MIGPAKADVAVLKQLVFWCLWALCTLSACTVTVDIQPGATVTCEDGSTCPEGFVCNPNSLRCQRDDLDFEPPGVESTTLTRSVIGIGDELQADIAVTEELGSVPSALLSGPGSDVPLNVQQTGDATYRLTAIPLSGSEVQEGNYDIVVLLTDRAGNTTSVDLGVTVELDATAPSAIPETGGVLLSPDPNTNLLREVERWRPGTDLELTFIASEPSDATVVLSDAAGVSSESGLSFTPRSTGGLIQILSLDQESSSPADGTYIVNVELVDRAGNSGLSPLTGSEGEPVTITIDRVAPPEPAVDAPGTIRFVRIPWGDRNGGAPRSLLELTEGALELNATLLLYADSDGTLEIGRFDLRDFDFETPIDLRIADRADLFVQAVDRAGNASSARRVRDVEWRATLSGKIPGSIEDNPHRFLSRAVESDAVEIFGQEEFGASQGIGAEDEAVATTEGQVSIVRAQVFDGPARRARPAAAYDPARGVIALYGGGRNFTLGDPFGRLSDLWELRNNAFSEPQVFESGGEGPPPSDELSFAYHPALARLLLGPGEDAFWEYDGTVLRRRDVVDELADGSPEPGSTLYWDIQRQSMFAFTDARTLWELVDDEWRAACGETCASTAPSNSVDASVMYSESRRVLELFAPEDSVVAADLDALLWSFDGERWATPCTGECATSGPAIRRAPALATDPITGDLLLFGGAPDTPEAGFESYLDLWRWNGTEWACMSPTVCLSRNASGCRFEFDPCNNIVGDFTSGLPEIQTNPGPIVVDPRSGGVHLFGGERIFGATGHYYFDGARWSETNVAPGDSVGGTSIFDPVEGNVLAFPGDNVRFYRFSDVWFEDCAFCGPREQHEAAFGYRPIDDQIVLLGGFDSGGSALRRTWEYNRNLGSFEEVCTNCGPQRPAGASLILDADTGDLVTINSVETFTTTNETWRFNGNQWSVSCPSAGCTSVTEAAQSAEAASSGTDSLLFVETTAFSETPSERECTEGAVRRFESGSFPEIGRRTFVRDIALTHDPMTNLFWTFGGDTNDECTLDATGSRINVLSFWDGTEWQVVRPQDPYGEGTPSPRSDALLAGRPNGPMVLYGGDGGDQDTWYVETGGVRRPEHVVRFNFNSAGADEGTELLDVALDWVGGCDGHLPVPSPGCELRVWTGSGFQATTTSDAPSDEVATLQWSSLTEPVDRPVQSLLFGRGQELIFSLRPRAANGSPLAPARVSTDAVEAIVRYRLPRSS